MPGNGNQTTKLIEKKRDFGSYMSRSMVMYEGGGGGRGNSISSGNGGSDFDDDCESWPQDGIGKAGANGSSSSGSADEGCYSGEGDKSSMTRSGSDDGGGGGGSSNDSSSSGGGDSGGGSSSGGGRSGSVGGDSGAGSSSGGGGSSDGSGSDGGGGINKGKWFISLRTVIDRMVGSERKGRSKKRVVKTILRPPTTYKYVIGMSGFPSKVPVYPKTAMM